MNKKILIILVFFITLILVGVILYPIYLSSTHKKENNRISIKPIDIRNNVTIKKINYNNSLLHLGIFDVLNLRNNSFMMAFSDILYEIFITFSKDLINWSKPVSIHKEYNANINSIALCKNSENNFFLYYYLYSGGKNDSCWCLKSNDGFDWTEPIKVNAFVTTNNLHTNSSFFFYTLDTWHCKDGTDIYTSNEGITWNKIHIEIVLQDFFQITTNQFIGISEDGIVYESNNLVDWKKKDQINSAFGGICFFNGSSENTFCIMQLKNNSNELSFIVYVLNSSLIISKPLQIYSSLWLKFLGIFDKYTKELKIMCSDSSILILNELNLLSI